MPEALYPAGGILLVLLTGAVWQRVSSNRRATLATLRSAVGWASLRGTSAAAIAGVSSYPHQPIDGPIRARLGISRLLGAIGRLARKITPPIYTASATRRLRLAGKGRSVDGEGFLAFRLLTLALILPLFAALELASPIRGLEALLAFILVAFLLALGPEALLNRMVSSRQEQIRRDLPAVAELLMISVEAGLGFDQALSRSATSVQGPLCDEFSRYLGEVRMGSARREALEALDRRTDVDELHSFLMALAQAETFGISIGSILRSQAKRTREAQHQHLQERAQKAPVKMLFPLVFCVLPALFVVVLGPAVIEIYRELIK
ncbi:MAG: type II secretion system F family protein [Acidimicrobiales bacterium]